MSPLGRLKKKYPKSCALLVGENFDVVYRAYCYRAKLSKFLLKNGVFVYNPRGEFRFFFSDLVRVEVTNRRFNFLFWPTKRRRSKGF